MLKWSQQGRTFTVLVLRITPVFQTVILTLSESLVLGGHFYALEQKMVFQTANINSDLRN